MKNENTVFISYSSKDYEIVNEIVEELEKMGVSYWKAPEMIPAGSSYAKEIPKAIQGCDVFLLILSDSSQESIWVEKETDNAICHRKIIIPIQIEELTLNDTFLFYLNNVQVVNYFKNKERAYEGLKKQLKLDTTDVVQEEKTQEKVEDKNENTKKEKPKQENTVSNDGDPRKRILSVLPINEDGSKRNRDNTNALRMNRIPLACQYCGCKELEYVNMGTYRCTRCSKDNYDDFQTIRNFLNKAGATSAIVIERETGVPRRIIEHFFREEYLEIPINSSVRVPCQSCGAPIRTGTLCDRCKAEGKHAEKKSKNGSWHSFL